MDVNRIIHGDALDVLRGLPDASVDMIFTDPPYGHNNNNGDLIHRREVALGKGELQQPRPIANDGAEADDVFQSVLPELARVLAPGGLLLLLLLRRRSRPAIRAVVVVDGQHTGARVQADGRLG